MWPWRAKMPTKNLLRLLLLLILMMRIVLATVCCILRSWGLVIKPNFCSDFKHKVWSRYWSWSSGKIFKLEFGQYFAADVLQRLWSWILVEILKMKFNQDLGLNLWYDPIGYFGRMNSTLGFVVPLAMFQTYNNHSTIAEDFSIPNTLWKKSVVIPLHIYSNHLQASSLFVSSFWFLDCISIDQDWSSCLFQRCTIRCE